MISTYGKVSGIEKEELPMERESLAVIKIYEFNCAKDRIVGVQHLIRQQQLRAPRIKDLCSFIQKGTDPEDKAERGDQPRADCLISFSQSS